MQRSLKTLAAALSLVALFACPAIARTIKSVKITAVGQNAVACGAATTVTVEVLVKVPNNFVGPESGTVLIMEHDSISDDEVGSATYTVTRNMINANREATVTTVATVNCYAANGDCECEFGNRPNQIDDEFGDHTIYAKEKDSGVKSKPNALTGGYIDIISCVKPGGKLAMEYPSYMQPGQDAVLIAVNFDQSQAVDQLDWTFAADRRYFSVSRAWFDSSVTGAFDAAFVDFGAHRPGEVRFQALNEIPNAVQLEENFTLYFEVNVSPETPFGEFAIATKPGSQMLGVDGRMVSVAHPKARLSIAPDDADAPVIDASQIAFDVNNQTIEGMPGAILDDYLQDFDAWVEIAVAIVGADGQARFANATSVAQDGHFILGDVYTESDDLAVLLIAADLLGNVSEHRISLQAEAADYRASVPSTGAGFGAWFDLGPCGQLAGWVDSDGLGLPAINVGGDVRVYESSSRLTHGLGTNARGWIVGQQQTKTGFAPFMLDPNTGVIPMGTLGGGRGTVYALDDSSNVAVGMSTASIDSINFEPTAWLISSEGGESWAEAIRLPGLGGTFGSARDINNVGTIAGSTSDRLSRSHAVVWTRFAQGEYGVTDLGFGTASAINDFGVVVGSLEVSRGVTRAFYHSNGQTFFLPTPASCTACSTSAVSINARGEIVGSSRQGSTSTPIYWNLEDLENSPVSISSFSLSNEVDASIDWVTAINDAGQILTSGKRGDTPVSVLLTPVAVDTNSNDIADNCEARPEEFTRGNVNGDLGFDIADPIFLLGYLFSGGDEPGCLDASDLNDDGSVDISDAVSGLGYLFLGGTTIAAPFPACGADETPDELSCNSASACSDLASGWDDDEFVKEPCDGGQRGNVLMGRDECRGGVLTRVEYRSYTCPDGSLQWVEESATPTHFACP